MEVQRCQLAKIWLRHVHIERLGLVNEGASVGSHLYQGTLAQLPYCLVQCLELIRYVKPLNVAWYIEAECTEGYIFPLMAQVIRR
jgi:hypothetical protein